MRYRLRLDTPLKRVILIALCSGICAYIALLVVARHQGVDPIALTGDARGYLQLAEHILHNQVFSFSPQAPFAPESFRAPGYPFFLAVLLVLFKNWYVVLFVQAVLVSAAPILLYLLFRSYHERAAFWGALLFSLEPTRLFLTVSFLSDALFACLFLLSLIALERGVQTQNIRWFLGAGSVLGAGILVRPIALFLPLLYGGYVLLRRGGSRAALVRASALIAACGLVIFPWMLRNHTVFGSWGISSVGSANLMLYNAPEFLRYAPDARGEAVLHSFNRQQAALPRDEALSLARSKVFTDTFLSIIRDNDKSYLVFHVVKTAPFFLTDGLRDTLRLFGVDVGTPPNLSTALLRGEFALVQEYLRTGGGAILLLVVGCGFWFGVMLLVLYTLGKSIRQRSSWPLLFYGVLVLYFALLTGPVSNARYRLPVEGLLLVAAASAWSTLSRRSQA